MILSCTKPFNKAILAGLVMLAVFSPVPAFGAIITVTSLADSGSGSLRAAIASASPGDTINFSVTGTIALTSGKILIPINLTINGPGASSLAIDGNMSSRVFQIGGGSIVAIYGLTIQNGSGGGGILNNGTLTLANSTLSGNSNSGGCSASCSGGIINDGGTVAVTNSTLSGNSTTSFTCPTGCSGGISNNGGGTVTVTNSTLSGNSTISSSGCYGGCSGGIINNGGTVAVTNSTLSGNSTTGGACPTGCGGGFANFYGTLTVKNSIVANSGARNCYGPVTSYGYNLSDDSSCFFGWIGDRNGVSAGLDPGGLQNNGGPTQTIALLPTSPAVDAIPITPISYCTATDGVTPISTDQRGVARPEGPACDIGAFELVEYTGQVQQPINPDGSSVFSVKRGVVPVKFTLTLAGLTICQLPAATIHSLEPRAQSRDQSTRARTCFHLTADRTSASTQAPASTLITSPRVRLAQERTW